MADTPPDFKHVKVHYASDHRDDYEKENRIAHAAIVEKLNTFGNLQAVLKVLGLLVLALIGAVIGFIAAGVTWVSNVEDHIHRVEIEEKSNAKEGFAVARSLQKEVNALQIAVRECQRRHGIGPQKE